MQLFKLDSEPSLKKTYVDLTDIMDVKFFIKLFIATDGFSVIAGISIDDVDAR